jgi:hypothetical protein
VLLDCPGPPVLQPSYLLCPQDSESDGTLGRDRVEIGQSVDTSGNLRMADVPIPPGAFAHIDEGEVISEVSGPDSDAGTKGCNGGGCHDAQAPLASAAAEQLSKPIDAFGDSPGNPDCIISTDRCDKSPISEPKQCFPSTEDTRVVAPQSLGEVCDCIEAASNDDLHPLAGEQVALLICRALQNYQDTRGGCATQDCPPATGPACSDEDAPCNPSTGATVATTSGYHCRPNDDDVLQCISDCPCRSYDLLGGGKFLVGSSVSMVRIEVTGHAGAPDRDDIHDAVGVTGQLSGFEYASRTMLDGVSFSSFAVTRSGADLSATGKGTANVNGVPTNIEFAANTTGGVQTFEVRDADTNEVLLGGTGEAGRADFQLTVTP